MHTLVDARPDFAQLNAALAAVDESIGAAASGADVARLADEVAALGAAQRAEHAAARWVWDASRAAGADQRVLWDAQPTNGLPTGCAWSRGDPDILVTAAGLYELKFGIFGAVGVRVRARLLANDETVAEASGPHAGASAGADLAAGGARGGGEEAARPPLGASSEAEAQARRARSAGRRVGKRGGIGRATIGSPRQPPPPIRPLAEPAAEPPPPLVTPARDGPRLAGPTCAALVCLLPNTRLSLALGGGAPVGALNGFLEVRKVFVGG